MSDSFRLLNQLTKLIVKHCSLGEFPFKTVEGESETLTESGVRRRCSNLDPSFDKCMLRLQHLKLYNIQILDEVSFGEGVFPNLQHLLIRSCNDLAVLGTLPNALVKLELTYCCKLRKIEGLCNLPKLHMMNIKYSIEMEELPSLETLVSLEAFDPSVCVKLKSIRGLEKLTKLRKLEVSSCSELEELPHLENLRSLEKLDVSQCVKLKSIEGLLQLTEPRTLKVRNCYDLKALVGVEHLKLLEVLEAFKCVKLKKIVVLKQLMKLRKFWTPLLRSLFRLLLTRYATLVCHFPWYYRVAENMILKRFRLSNSKAWDQRARRSRADSKRILAGCGASLTSPTQSTCIKICRPSEWVAVERGVPAKRQSTKVQFVCLLPYVYN